MLQILTLLGNTEPPEKHECGMCFACPSVNDSAGGRRYISQTLRNAKVGGLV